MDNLGLTFTAPNAQSSPAIGEMSVSSWSSNLVYSTQLRPESAYLRELEIESPDVMVMGMKTPTQGIVKMRVGTYCAQCYVVI